MISANLHNVAKVEACTSGDTAWFSLMDADGNKFTAFVPLPVAEAMAQAFNGTRIEAAAATHADMAAE